MDTSITIALIFAVVFAVVLPSFLKRIGRAAERADLDRVPAQAQEVGPDTGVGSCLRSDGPRLLDAETEAAAFLPPAGPDCATEAPRLRLDRALPQFSVIDGDLSAPGATREVEAEPVADVGSAVEEDVQVLPLAVGQSGPLYTVPTFTASPDLDRPDISMSPSNQTPSGDARRPSRGPGSGTPGSRPAAGRGPSRPAPAGVRRAAGRPRPASTGSAPAGRSPRAGSDSAPEAPSTSRHTAGSVRSGRRDGDRLASATAGRGHQGVDRADTDGVSEQLRSVRRTVPIAGGLVVLFGGAALVSALLAVFSLVSWALPGLCAVLAAGAFVVLRTLHTRIRTLTGRQPEEASGARHVSPRGVTARDRSGAAGARDSAVSAREGAATSGRTSSAGRESSGRASSAEDRPGTASPMARAAAARRAATARKTVPKKSAAEAASNEVASDRAPSTPTTRTAATGKAAEARSTSAPAGSTQSASTQSTSTQATSGSAAEAGVDRVVLPGSVREDEVAIISGTDTVRVPLLTERTEKPWQERVKRRTAGASRTDESAQAGTAGTTDRTAAADTRAGAGEGASAATTPEANGGDDLATETPRTVPTGSRRGLFEQRMDAARRENAKKAAARIGADTAWKPSPVPTPTYVGKDQAPRNAPDPVVADATSFSLEPRTRESIAAEFAEELGFRPELADSARETSGALDHGRTAIGADRTRTAMTGGLDELLARRRA
ncbi:hypothetical protein [Brevibacterium litoralis]|uniref:hypothetical protein n=1 Tax=Brevibacterium litoralis TaxID=3138935 RepID=UPI0032EF1BB7